jgi:hypothetical protein
MGVRWVCADDEVSAGDWGLSFGAGGAGAWGPGQHQDHGGVSVVVGFCTAGRAASSCTGREATGTSQRAGIGFQPKDLLRQVARG